MAKGRDHRALGAALRADYAAPMASIIASSTTETPAVAWPGAIAAWLLSVAALVFVMVVVGGITRLTESGLSITRWDVVRAPCRRQTKRPGRRNSKPIRHRRSIN